MTEDMDLEVYSWLYDELEWFGEAGCITVITSGSVEDLARALHVDLGAAAADGLSGEVHEEARVGFTNVDGRAVAVEDNGFAGSNGEVVSVASGGGRAASAFWNVNAHVRFTCAEDGRVLYDSDFAMHDSWNGLPEDLVPLARLAASDDQSDWEAISLAMLERFTGVRVTAEDVRSALRRTYPVA